MTTSSSVWLIFPHQLFQHALTLPKGTVFVLVEDDLFFKQFKFHKQKLVLHRASIVEYAEELKAHGHSVEHVKTSAIASMEVLSDLLTKLHPKEISYYEVTDDYLEKRLRKLFRTLGLPVHRYESPGFLTSLGLIDEYFSTRPNRMQYFYEWQRKRLDILMEAGKPKGGKWSFDSDNRKKLPKGIVLPKPFPASKSEHIKEAQTWVEEDFGDNYGQSGNFNYPVTHTEAVQRLQDFLKKRFQQFGPYEDAISETAGEAFHSVLSSSLNIGILTPQEVVEAALQYADKHDIPIESLEGFIRQVIGWREYMRATYVKFGVKMRTTNYLEFNKKLKEGWWMAAIGLDPVDKILERVDATAYAHHIERLMVFGNLMVLLRIDPDEAYEWFMTYFIDAYDWVMVPNVYAMSQFAAGELITTKPYISGSNYVLKMSDFKTGEWAETWNALYWKFVHDYTEVLKKNFRLQMVTKTFDRFTDEKKASIEALSAPWITD